MWQKQRGSHETILLARHLQNYTSTEGQIARLFGGLSACGVDVGREVQKLKVKYTKSQQPLLEQWKKVHRSRQRQEYLFWRDLKRHRRFVKQENKRVKQGNKRVKQSHQKRGSLLLRNSDECVITKGSCVDWSSCREVVRYPLGRICVFGLH